jgi:hypothetical protein
MQKDAKAGLVEGFENTLKLLLPTPQDIRPKLTKLIDEAVELANLMTCEQALFQCDIVTPGMPFNCKYMDTPEDKQTGQVYLCTFPLFTKRVMRENGKETKKKCLVTASVELESVVR